MRVTTSLLALVCFGSVAGCAVDEGGGAEELELDNGGGKEDGDRVVTFSLDAERRSVRAGFTCDEALSLDLCDLTLTVPQFTVAGGLDGKASGPVVLLDVLLIRADGVREKGVMMATYDASSRKVLGTPDHAIFDIPHGRHFLDFSLRDITSGTFEVRAEWD